MFTEDSYEKALLGIFSSMGYQVEYGPEIDRDYTVPVYESVLETSVRRLNPALSDVAVSEAIKKWIHGMDGNMRCMMEHIGFTRIRRNNKNEW